MEVLAVESPFLHVLTAQVLSAAEEAQVLSTLEGLEWKAWSSEFFRLRVSANSNQLDSLKALPALQALIGKIHRALELHFRKSLSCEASFAVQMYDENATIGFHTDETAPDVRFILNLNRNWTLSDGGVWVLSNEPTLDGALFIPPLSNTGFAFAPDPNSFHALSRRCSSISYGVVMSFPVLQA
jgi:hypothetical protein